MTGRRAQKEAWARRYWLAIRWVGSEFWWHDPTVCRALMRVTR